MNKIVNKFLLVGAKFMPELHLRQPGFTPSVSRLFMKHLEIKKFRETGQLKHTYKTQLDKTCFNAGYSNSKDLAKRTVSDKTLKDRAYKIAINPEYDGYQKGLASMVYKLFDMNTGSGAKVNEELAQELHKPVIKKFKIRRIMRDLKIIFGQQI